jgi:5-deoxy-5-amino-3-dehydroquinate synthase
VTRIRVELGTGGYDVVVAAGALAGVGEVLADRRRCAIVSQPAVAEHYAGTMQDALPTAEVFLVDDGEEAKSLATVESLCRRFAAWGLLRDDAVVALGGGVVGDVAGFAAATYHRGVDVVQAPTTLLAMVDSAIGGKTGVNLPEGKNLVGAFHQPLEVVADVDTLATLPAPDYRSGLGEVAKYALMGDEALAGLLRDHAPDLLDREPGVVADVVARCAGHKAAVVAADPDERTGLRATLNYGHTLAHAVETVGGYSVSHGEAVAVGLVFAGELARALERIDGPAADEHRTLVESLGLPTAVPDGADAAGLVAVMRRDKKARGGLTFVLRGPNGLETVTDPPAPALEHALHAVGVQGSVSVRTSGPEGATPGTPASSEGAI